MNPKSFFLHALLALSLPLSGSADEGTRARTNEEWQVHTYPEIGLRMRLPHWKVDVEDQSRLWSLLAYPLVQNPVTDVQYRVVISANIYTESQYLKFIRNRATNSSGWSNSEHLQTSQMTNSFWIYTRRDIWCPGGSSYACTGRIKRIQNGKPIVDERLGGSEVKLADEVRRILDSIQILSTNVVKLR